MDRIVDDLPAGPFPPGWDSFVSARDRFLATLAAESAARPRIPSTDEWLVQPRPDDGDLLGLRADW